MTDSTEDIRKQVQDRVDAEAAAIPPAEEPQAITSEFIRECLFANELGDGTLYARLYRGRYVYCKNAQEWYEWAEHCWKRDIMNRSTAAVEGVVDEYLDEYKLIGEQITKMISDPGPVDADRVKKMEMTQANLLKRISQLRADKRRTSCLKFAHTIVDPLAISGEGFDAHPLLFPCANGVIDLETGRLKPGRPDDYLSLSSPVPFLGIDEPAPIWQRSLCEIFGGDHSKAPDAAGNESATAIAAYLNRLCGYFMTGLVKEKVFPVFYGKTGWNGRSLIVETISHVMGELAASIPSEMLLSQKYGKSSSGPSPDIMSLKGIRLAFASEIDEGQRFSVSKIKWLTGKDELVGRNPHDKYQTRFQPTHKLVVMTNTQPSAPAHDKAFWERLHLIPFLISFVNRDPRESYERRANLNLDKEILAEASGILAWLVRGCLEYQRIGLAPPREVLEATEQYRRSEDLLADFLDECCVVEAAAKERAKDLFDRFKDWYGDNVGKNDKLTGTWFGKLLSHRFEKRKSNGVVYYFGVALKTDQGELPG